MTTDEEFIGQLEGYLHEYAGSTPLPDPIRHAVRTRLRTTRQLGPVSGPMRELKMSNALRIGLAAAAVVVIAVGVYSLLPGGPFTGAEPTPTPVPSADATPAPSPAASESAEPAALTPGQHTFGPDAFGLTYTFDIPSDGWSGLTEDVPILGIGVEPEDALMAVFANEHVVYADPCQWEGSEVDPPTTTVDAIAAALATQPGRDATPPIDVTISGYAGKVVELTVPDDAVFADCDGGQYRSWGPDESVRYHQAPGQIDRDWILDVDGDIIVVVGMWMPGTDPAMVAELESIVESMVISAE